MSALRRFHIAAFAGSVLFASLGAQAKPAPTMAYVLDAGGRAVPIESLGLSLTRTAPAVVAPAASSSSPSDGVSLVVTGDQASRPTLELETTTGEGIRLDGLSVPLTSIPCPAELVGPCAKAPRVRLVADLVDRDHPSARSRSMLAELGGELRVRFDEGKVFGTLVLAPRIEGVTSARARVRLRFVLVKLSPEGPPPIGRDRGSARVLVQDAVRKASALWSSCGLSLGAARDVDIQLVEPPPPHLVSVGCSHGLPASGGELRIRVEGKVVRTAVAPGTSPRAAARRLARALEDAGFAAELSDNPRIASAALPTTDVLVRGPRGAPLAVTLPRSADGTELAVSSDPTLAACIGGVNLEDGLQHFGDVDSAVGTLEERALVKAFDDHDPTTLDVYVVPGFARGGRIGESFIFSDRGSIANTILLDRAGMRPSRAGLTLAHELGHVLLDDPGHPDDFAVDTPTALMDADASDPSAFGPRRLSLDECARAWRQSGVSAPVRLLHPF